MSNGLDGGNAITDSISSVNHGVSKSNGIPSMMHGTRSRTLTPLSSSRTSSSTATIKGSLCTDNSQATKKCQITSIRSDRAPKVTFFFAPTRRCNPLVLISKTAGPRITLTICSSVRQPLSLMVISPLQVPSISKVTSTCGSAAKKSRVATQKSMTRRQVRLTN